MSVATSWNMQRQVEAVIRHHIDNDSQKSAAKVKIPQVHIAPLHINRRRSEISFILSMHFWRKTKTL